jgi:hypothetical protein
MQNFKSNPANKSVQKSPIPPPPAAKSKATALQETSSPSGSGKWDEDKELDDLIGFD